MESAVPSVEYYVVEVTERVKTKKVYSLFLSDDGIVNLRFPISGGEVKLSDSINIYHQRLTLETAFKKQLLLVDIRNSPKPNRDAKEYAKSKELTDITQAMAMLVDSRTSRVIGNMFIGLNRPPYPTRLFTDETVAVEWLKRQEQNVLG